MQDQIVAAFGKSEHAADTFGGKLTDAIVGPLDDIKRILGALARQAFGINLHLNDHGAQKDTDHLRKSAEELSGPFGINYALNDHGAQKATDHLHDSAQALHGPFGINFALNDEQVHNEIDGIRNALGALTQHEYNVIIHTKGGSPLPDEALRLHLTEPMKRIGFRKVGDRWSLPLDVTAHTDTDYALSGTRTTDPVSDPAQQKPTGMVATLRSLERQQMRLIGIERDERDLLRDIRKHVQGGGGGSSTGGSGGGGGGGKSGGGKSDPFTAVSQTPIAKALADIFNFTEKSGATVGEAMGIVRKIAQRGPDNAFIKSVIQDARHELGPVAAKQYAVALHILDERTKTNSKHQEDAIKSALRMLQNAVERHPHRDMTFGPSDEGWLDFQLKHAPRLPSGHTNIDQNQHRPRYLPARIDRRHMDDQADYQNTYGRGY